MRICAEPTAPAHYTRGAGGGGGNLHVLLNVAVHERDDHAKADTYSEHCAHDVTFMFFLCAYATRNVPTRTPARCVNTALTPVLTPHLLCQHPLC
eukprot:369777-Prymnesium_polylepis.1